ncbi:hypothetical protein JDV02_001944 [Purpureocillium takamizusanense]|uniref:Uncharacterized protein n=1 Tax=Purpureocillium takamizusanense TaxID=2060973 RepID=A0A9Q8V818_9HYPO|nr:uncharacterized protein JDV02_001944 [Purpureocillium takamizusanense]UNI15409.1 hypothetical protein JDV02_001944 [Purpureocillium takamizusanense]
MTSYIVATPFEAYLPGLFISECFNDNPCTLAVSATALATFARRVKCDKYLDMARRNYSSALVRTNEALADTSAAVLDSTLAAVLLLGLFEAVVFQGGQAPTNWTAHTLGAMQLLRLRGKGQFKSHVSQKLYAQASNNIKTSCIQKSMPLPADFVAFNEEVGPLLDPGDPAIRISPVVDRMARIKAQALIKVDAHLIREAWQLDREIANFGQNMPSKMRYVTHNRSPPNPEAGSEFSYDYPNLRTAKVWNALRLLRQFLVTFISNSSQAELDVMGPDLQNTPSHDALLALRRYAVNNMGEISEQILATVPSFLESGLTERRFYPAARSLVWPLTIIESTGISYASHRELAALYLKELACDLNLPQAVHPDRDPGHKDDWLHLFHVG